MNTEFDFKETSDKVCQQMLEYINANIDKATGDRFYWEINRLVFWIANGVDHFRLDSRFGSPVCTVPEEIWTPEVKKVLYKRYLEWLSTSYSWKAPSDNPTPLDAEATQTQTNTED